MYNIYNSQVTLESNRIEFLNDVTFDKEDMLSLELLDSMEKTLQQDEERLRQLDDELNKLIRTSRQTQPTNQDRNSSPPPDSPIHHLGPYTFNGQLNSQTLRVNPLTRNRRQVKGFDEARVDQLTVNNIDVAAINGIPFQNFIFLQSNGELSLPNSDVIFEESIQVNGDVTMLNDGKVNNIDLSREILAIDSPNSLPESLKFENVITENLIVETINEIPVNSTALNDLNLSFEDNLPIIKTKRALIRDNLNVETINGVKWNEFVSKLVSKEKPAEIDSLTVTGNLWIVGDRGEINAQKVNDLQFPQGYVVKKGATETVIGGKKIFTKALGEFFIYKFFII